MSAVRAVDALTDYEQQIETALGTMQASWTTIAQCLQAIHDGGLYTPYGTWEAYCRSRWGHSRQWGYELVAAAAVLNNVRCILHDGPLPQTIQQAKTLVRLEPADQSAVWQEAVTRYGESPTGAQVAAIARPYRGVQIVEQHDEDGGRQQVFAPAEPGVITQDAAAMLTEHVLDVQAVDDIPLEEAACIVAETELPSHTPDQIIDIVQHYQATIADEVPVSPTPPVEEPLPTAAESPPVKKAPDVEWYTPADYIAAARAVLGTIDLDPASCAEANETVQAPRFYTEEDDGLTQPWHGRIWCNPPYIRPTRWIARMIEQYQNGAMPEGLLLLNSSTGSEWFQPLWAYPICFVANRINFQRPAAKVNLERPHYDSVIVYFGPNVDRFTERFRAFGPVVQEVVR